MARRERERKQGAPTVAPAEVIRQELRYLQSRETLRTRVDVEEMVFIQSIVGRAHEGHGGFRGRRYVDTAEDDVAAALRLDPYGVRADRQELLDSIRGYARRAMAAGMTPASTACRQISNVRGVMFE